MAKKTTKVEKMANPVKTLWWETYQLWDEVLYQVGKAYYKAKPPKRSRSKSGSGSRSRPRSDRTGSKKGVEGHEARNMQLVRQGSYSSDAIVRAVDG
ncbi:hypothetical protein VSDG_09166 [Cytospora chrysosperma]|uniref:Uncharacterized protein n=1 Tax=Cytospora chrysosperma TaxID=252740 RepID=A0A423VAU3_CYTCH|nr:hypothetical protein VSDG_09166 [Valsa sordida]